jgi:hypothetical protein
MSMHATAEAYAEALVRLREPSSSVATMNVVEYD